MESHEFLKKKYDLHTSEEVESAAKRTEKHTGEKIPQDPSARIENYLQRFGEIIERKDSEKRERGLGAIKRILYDKYVIKPEEIPEKYFEAQQRMAREQGHGDIEITPELREQATEVIIADQRSSLDAWVDYLASPDATYPDWLKYWAIRNVLGMGEYDKEKQKFTKRSRGTTKPFPDINREALAYVLDVVKKKYEGKDINLDQLGEEDRAQLQKLLQGESFPKLYAWAVEKTAPSEKHLFANTEGVWVEYNQNADHMPLVESLQGHGTGWCTAGESTAEAQLKGGDFYVYYSLDKDGKATIPRAAIRMEEDRIGEVRGIAEQQNLDSYIAPVVEKKLASFPDGALYEKKTSGMKRLTQLEKKTQQRESLTKEDLLFLYEVDATIEGFGYERDPRIAELRATRDLEEDMLVIFECTEDQIAHNSEEIDNDTRAYVGELQPGIFIKLQEYNIEHIYTSFPEGRIRQIPVELGGKTRKELITELEARNINISSYARYMLMSKDFTTQKHKEEATLIRLTVKDLGFNNYATTNDLYKRAEALDLELCPPETGPQYRLQYEDQPLGDWVFIGMKQIADRDGGPRVFDLERDGGGLWLDDGWAGPEGGWGPEDSFLFRPRKLGRSDT